MGKTNLIVGTLITYSENNPANNKGKKYADKEIKFRLAEENTVTGAGRLITPHACFQMVKEKFDDSLNGTNNISREYKGYIIGKEAILQILAQQNCEGIMVMECQNDQGDASLVFAGVDTKKSLLKKETFPIDDDSMINNPELKDFNIPMVVERIGLVSSNDIINKLGMDPQFNEKSTNEKAIFLTKLFLGLE